LVESDFQFDLTLQLAIFLPGLFLGCLFCHGELYRLRPAPSRLTAFYLAVSAGGALGGLLVRVAAPLVFTGYYELGAGLVMLALLAAVRFADLNAWARYGSLAVLIGVAGCAAYDGFRYHPALRSLDGRPARVGVIGLGTGTIAAYGRAGDVYRFYEIDARVMQVALHEFTYLGDSKAKIELALGDARLALEREAPRRFDVLAVDAFSSDA